MRKYHSVSVKIIFITIIVIFLIMLSTGIVTYLAETKQSKILVEKDDTITVKRLANSLRQPLWNYDKKEVINVVYLEITNPDVIYILVYNDCDEFYHGQMKNAASQIVIIENENDLTTHNNEVYTLKVFDIIRDSQKAGYIKIAFSSFSMQQRLKKIIKNIIFQILILTFFIVIIIYVTINKVILQPIYILNRVVGRFADKDFSARLNNIRLDEIGSLSDNFNAMASIIEEYGTNLEKLVENRTKELRLINQEVIELNHQMKNELIMARRIQLAIIPVKFPGIKNVSFSGMYVPMSDIGGDYYDAFEISENLLGIVIADVCGHGVSAALITTMVKMAFSSNSSVNKTTGEIVRHVNQQLFEVIGGMEYLTAFFCIINTATGELQYTNAGHPDIYLQSHTNEMKKFRTNSPIIGFDTNIDFHTNYEHFEKGDRLILYTDGITETRNSKGEFFNDIFMQLLETKKNAKANELIDEIILKINFFREDIPTSDDLALLIIDIGKS